MALPNNGESNKLSVVLSRQNANLLIDASAAQMFVYGVNTGKLDGFKYLLFGCSVIFLGLLLWRIWFTSAQSTKRNTILKILMFTLIFNLLLLFISRYFGGFAVFAAGIMLLWGLVKIEDTESV